MQLKKYIKGDRRGKEANRLEREAMNDPFLQDALDGFDAVPGNHAEIIEQLSLKVQGTQNDQSCAPKGVRPLPHTSSTSSLFSPFFFSIAASILLLIGFGIYFLLERNNDPYISAFVTLQTIEEEIEITPGHPLLPSELAKESETDAQTMEPENANRAALAKSAPAVASQQASTPAVTSQQASTPAARAIMPASEHDLSAQTESRNAAPSTSSQTTQKPLSLVEQQDAVKRAENNMDSNIVTAVELEQKFLAEITVYESEEDESEEDVSTELMFIPIDSIETAKESEKLTFSGKVVDELGDLEEDTKLLSEVVIVGYGVQKKNILKGAIPTKKEKRNDTKENSAKRISSNKKFGEKEFQDYCRQKAGKNACDGKKVSVRVSFFIDASGKPTQIKYERFTCEKAKEEIELLLSASPVWTNINRKVTMTIRW